MIKKLIDWITGKSEPVVKSVEVDAPYKVEAMPLGTEATIIAVSHSDIPIEFVPSAIETATVTVKAKYKRAALTAMTKAQLMELVTKHSVEVKARATKEELIKVLVKV